MRTPNRTTFTTSKHPGRSDSYSSVYVIGAASGSPMRIGCSADLNKRLSEGPAWNWNELQVLFRVALDGKLGGRVVSRCHELLDAKNLRIRGDWFNVPLEWAKKTIM